MAINGNKALDLDGLSHFYDDLCAYGIGTIAEKDGTVGGAVTYNGQITSDHNNHILEVDNSTTFMLGHTLMSNYGIKLGVVDWSDSSYPTLTLDQSSLTFDNGAGRTASLTPPSDWAGGSIATEEYVDGKTWNASDITSGTLSTARIPNISASKITSGTLPIERGGTGRTTAPSMLVNLASTNAASPLAATPRPGVTGILSEAHGGTGVSSLTDLIRFEYIKSTKTLNITVDESLM